MYSPTSAWWKQTIAIGSACLHSDVALAATPNPCRNMILALLERLVRKWKYYQWNISHVVNNNSLIFCCALRNSAKSRFHYMISINKLLLSSWLQPNFVLRNNNVSFYFLSQVGFNFTNLLGRKELNNLKLLCEDGIFWF